jgi:hypothetical protein
MSGEREGTGPDATGEEPELVPASTQIWGEGRSGRAVGDDPIIWVDGLRSPEVGVQLLNRVTGDKAFRQRLQDDPIHALAEVGVQLSPETTARLREALKEQPDLMTKAMGEQFEEFLPEEALVAALPLVIVGVQVVKYVGVVVAVGTRTRAVASDAGKGDVSEQ